MELHYYPTSHWSRLICLMAAETGARFDPVLVDIFKGANLQPEYLQLNPRGVVPTLVDDENVVWDSRRIAAYLNKKQGTNLCRTDEADYEIWVERLHEFPVRHLTYSVRLAGPDGERHAQALIERSERAQQLALLHPHLKEAYLRKASFFDTFRGELADAAFIAEQKAQARATLEEMGEICKSSKWIAHEFCFADCFALSILYRLTELGLLDEWASDPEHGLYGYFERLCARPSYRAVFCDDPLLAEIRPPSR